MIKIRGGATSTIHRFVYNSIIRRRIGIDVSMISVTTTKTTATTSIHRIGESFLSVGTKQGKFIRRINNIDNNNIRQRHVKQHQRKFYYSTQQHSINDDVSDNYNNKKIALIKSLPVQYLHEIDPMKYNSLTGQRNDVLVDKSSDTLVENYKNCTSKSIQNCSFENGEYYILWNDGTESIYPLQLIEDSIHTWKADEIHYTDQRSNIQQIYWSDMDENNLRTSLSIPFKDLIFDDNNQKLALQLLYQYGILLVSDTPTTDETAPGAVAVLASIFGGSSNKYNNNSSLVHHFRQGNCTLVGLPYGTDGPLQTLFGTVWSTTVDSIQSDGSSFADSAYTNDALPLHTDLTYHLTPPGLQLFTMQIPGISGGESILCDGFAIANKLRELDPQAFHTLSTTIRKYRSIDPTTGWNLQASGPIISVLNDKTTNIQRQTIQSIRHNDLDRLPDLPPPRVQGKDNINMFYDQLQSAHALWNTLLCDSTYRLVISLQKGDTIVVANQRVLHGRYAFVPPRSIIGCYVGQDELNSRFRMEGYNV